jgi:hypothetical protein
LKKRCQVPLPLDLRAIMGWVCLCHLCKINVSANPMSPGFNREVHAPIISKVYNVLWLWGIIY